MIRTVHLPSTVVEKSILHYNETREAYRNTFSKKINIYRVNRVTMAIDGLTARVSDGYGRGIGIGGGIGRAVLYLYLYLILNLSPGLSA